MSSIVWPASGPVSAVKVNLNVFVLPAATWSGVTWTSPTPGAAGLCAGTTSSASPSPSTGTSARQWSFTILTTGPLRVREAEVKQASCIAVGIRGGKDNRDQPRPPSPGGGDQAVPGDRRPARLDPVGAAVRAQEPVLVHVHLCVGWLGP